MESIYNLVPQEYVAPVKPPMYRSMHDPSTPLAGSTFGCKGTTRLLGAGQLVVKDGALFGPRESHEKPDPKEYLRKSESKLVPRATEEGNTFKYTDREKPPVPTRDEKPAMGLSSQKNFITANAVEAILQVPRVLDDGGARYLKKDDYGKVPGYLTQVKEEIRREKEMINKYVEERMGYRDEEPDRMELMGDDERQNLLDSLKAKWDATNQKYQRITHIVNLDTVGQVRRKTTLEKELKQIEKDIENLSRPGPIYVRA